MSVLKACPTAKLSDTSKRLINKEENQMARSIKLTLTRPGKTAMTSQTIPLAEGQRYVTTVVLAGVEVKVILQDQGETTASITQLPPQ